MDLHLALSIPLRFRQGHKMLDRGAKRIYRLPGEIAQIQAVLPEIKSEPGTALPVRLGVAESPAAKVGWLFGISLFWNGIVSVFVMQIAQSWMTGHGEWFQTLFMLPFVTVGIGLLAAFIREAMIAARITPTEVEVETEPLSPGDHVRLSVRQPGPLRVDHLTADLVCEEKITYRRGTDTYHESHRVWEQRLLDTGPKQIDSDRPWEQTVNAQILADSPHSFRAPNNEIVWNVVIKGRVPRWPGFSYEFPLRVVSGQARVRLGRNGPGVQREPRVDRSVQNMGMDGMWECGKCQEHIEGSFQTCWNCGTSREGIEDPTFRPVAKTESLEPVHITLDEKRGCFAAGGTLRGRFRVAHDTAEIARGVELTVLWYTEGKGDTDAGIVHEETFDGLRGEQDYPFSAALPLLPLTYYGRLLKIHWMVRVRVVKWGKDIVHDRPFVLLSIVQTSSGF